MSLNITKEEKFKISELRSRIHPLYKESDEKYVTWLRARELNVDLAEQMLRRHLIWRKNNEVEELKNWRSPKCFFPAINCGFDFEGCPVFIMPIGRWEIRATIENGDMVPCLRYIYQSLEFVIDASNIAKKYQGIIIFDFDGFGYRQLAHRTVIQGILEVLRVFESNYPETLKAAIVINAPKVFNMLFALIKPLLNSRTLAKVQIFNSDRCKWQETLLSLIPSDQLPPFWGGTKKGVDEFCSDEWFYEPLPKYFMKKLGASYDEFGDEWYQVKIGAGEIITLDYEVENNSTEIKWAFTTEGYDIGFSLHFEEKEKTEAQNSAKDFTYLLPFKRVESHLEKIEGKMRATRPGRYVISFDNSFSRSRSKVINYLVSLIDLSVSQSEDLEKDQKVLLIDELMNNNDEGSEGEEEESITISRM